MDDDDASGVGPSGSGRHTFYIGAAAKAVCMRSIVRYEPMTRPRSGARLKAGMKGEKCIGGQTKPHHV